MGNGEPIPIPMTLPDPANKTRQASLSEDFAEAHFPRLVDKDYVLESMHMVIEVCFPAPPESIVPPLEGDDVFPPHLGQT